MTITTAILLAILIAFTLNLLFLIFYIGPILTEVRAIVRDAREVTDIAKNRVKKVDSALDRVSHVMSVFDRVTSLVSKFGKSKGKSKKVTEED